MPTPPKPGDAGYGTAPEGSLSEERAKKAAVWVEKEVYKLLGEIELLGRTSGNQVQVTFGELFVHYQDVSDTLVGIMARAKKRGLIAYEGQGGQMLFQGKHDHVVVTLDKAKSDHWRKEYLQGVASQGNELPSTASAVPKKQLTVKEQFDEEKKKRASATPPNSSTLSSHASSTISSASSQQSRSSTRQAATPATPATPAIPPTPATPPPVVTSPEPEPQATASHAGFLATMMSMLLSSPTGSNPPPEFPEPSPSPPKEESPKEKPKEPEPAADSSTLTRSLMASLSKLLPSQGSMSSTASPSQGSNTSDLDEGTLNAIRKSARQSKAMSVSSTTSSLAKSASAPTFKPINEEAAAPSNTHEVPVLHAALPQRTRDGTRGAVLKSSSSPPKSPRKPVSSVASHAASSVSRPVSTPAAATAPVKAAVVTKPTPAASGTLKKEQEEWTKKHVQRGVVASGGQSAYAKLAAFQDKPEPFQQQQQKAGSSASNVGRKTDMFEKTKQSSTLPTGLQKRFAWE